MNNSYLTYIELLTNVIRQQNKMIHDLLTAINETIDMDDAINIKLIMGIRMNAVLNELGDNNKWNDAQSFLETMQ